MTFVVTENCIKCKFTDCVDVCNVDCFHEGPDFLVIDPDECIDCNHCEPECPANAIYPDDELPEDQVHFLELNAELSKKWPIITEVKEPLKEADKWNGILGKKSYLGIDISEEDLQVGFVSSVVEERVRSIRLLKVLTESQVELAINDQNYEVCMAVINRHDINFSDDQIEHLLTKSCTEVHLAYLNSHYGKLAQEQFSRGIESSNGDIRVAYLNRKEFKLTLEKIEHFLNDPYSKVREVIAARRDLKLNAIQIERGLTDSDTNIQWAILNRRDVEFTIEQFERGLKSEFYGVSNFFKEMLRNNSNSKLQKHALTNEDPSIRRLAVENLSENLAQDQIAIGLLDSDVGVRIAYLHREECVINEQLLESSFKDQSSWFCLSCLNKYLKPFSEQQINMGLSSHFDEVRKYFASCLTVKLSEPQVLKLLKDATIDVKLAVIARPDFQSTPENIAICLMDKSVNVRLAIAQENDFNPTHEQIVLGLSDKSDKVKLAFLRCIKAPIKSLNIVTKLGTQYGDLIVNSTQLEGCFSGEFLAELCEVNFRLSNKIMPENIAFGIHKATHRGIGACVLLKANNWEGGKKQLVFMVNTQKGIRIRIQQTLGSTPAIWDELRGFPRGKVTEKLEKWASATDGYLIPIDEAKTMPEGDSNCHIDEWIF